MATNKLVWERVERNIQDRISAWHQLVGIDINVSGSLAKYLGWTEEEFGAWVEDPKKIPEREFEK